MGYGSTVAVGEAEEEYREACVEHIEKSAAKLVGVRDIARQQAIEAETEALRQEIEADNDVTGTLAAMLNSPVPNKRIAAAQAITIGQELRGATSDSAESF